VVFYDREYYKDALKKFKQVNELNRHYPGLAFYIKDSEKRLKQNEEKKSSMIRLDLLVFGFFLFGAIMLLKYLGKKRMKLKA
jgi:hypothetical protein